MSNIETELRRTLGVGMERGRTQSNASAGGTGSRRMSRATEIRPANKQNRPLMDWLYDHFDKTTVGLCINFLILIVLLMLLKNFAAWVPGLKPEDS